jgi:beta-lactamase superfamily II metal-dependent hydrolase
MKIHFLNVGHGDCTIIENANGHLTVVDINNGQELDEKSLESLAEAYHIDTLDWARASILHNKLAILESKGYDIELTNPIEYLNTNFNGRSIWRYIQTHPHMDHMKGLAALKDSSHSIANFWDTEHSFTPPSLTPSQQEDWNAYNALRGESSSSTVLRLSEGAKAFSYNQDEHGNAPGDGIEILHPPVGSNTAAPNDNNINNISYVLRITHNGVVTILGGDAEEAVWQYLVDTYGDSLKCDVLQASHHGRDSGFHNEAVKLMAPQYTIVSVGKKPDQDASNKYRNHSDNVWSTRWKGNIVLDTTKKQISSQYDR